VSFEILDFKNVAPQTMPHNVSPSTTWNSSPSSSTHLIIYILSDLILKVLVVVRPE
jgi:hypothetical protein